MGHCATVKKGVAWKNQREITSKQKTVALIQRVGVLCRSALLVGGGVLAIIRASSFLQNLLSYELTSRVGTVDTRG